MATEGEIYIFGGGNNRDAASNSIERYKISKDTMTLLNLKIPHKISFAISARVSSTQILILGGTIQTVSGEKFDQSKSVYSFIYSGLEKEILKTADLPKPVLSIYSAFEFY